MSEAETTQQQQNADGESWKAELERLRIVPANEVKIWRDEFRRLHVQVIGGEEFVDVRPAPVFPVSQTANFISFLDTKDKEALLLRDLGKLEEESRKLLVEELGRAYFVPRIIRIYEIEDAHGASRWEVETDRGYRMFDIRDREDVRVIRKTRVLLQDADGNRFEIEDVTKLDEKSQQLLETEI
jgi:hypothetical protein